MDHDELARRWAPTLRASDTAAEVREAGEKWPHLVDRAQQDEAYLFSSQNPEWEDVAKRAADPGPHTGVMVALYPDADTARQLAIDDGESPDDLHVTLAFLGEVGGELAAGDASDVLSAVQAWAATQKPIAARTNGLGMFTEPDDVTYANIDSPDLPAFRQSLIEALDAAGHGALQNHGFTPHMTLKYGDARDTDVPGVDMNFDHVVLAFAGNHTKVPLQGKQRQVASAKPVIPPEMPYGTSGSSGTFIINPGAVTMTGVGSFTVSELDNPAQKIAEPQIEREEEIARAITVEVNGRQLIAAPARAGARMPTVEDIADDHMLYMHGRFVGADEPNRNGALWSAGDLELARATVVNGPLNWLHEATHVIGSIASADYVNTQQAAAIDGDAGGGGRAHITATAGIWRWVYPDEAYVVQQASDMQQLWYSMECISKEVACTGPGGCGNVTSYSTYMSGAACAHVTQRASVRQFKNPTFLGGAVIVPPIRPGWAEADARVMQKAEGLAEAAFDQAGQPDIPASAWEQMMAQLIKQALSTE